MPRSFIGSSSQPSAATAHSDADRANRGLEATAPLLSDGNPHKSRVACTAVASLRSRPFSAVPASAHDNAESTSDDGIASRRAMLPNVSQANCSRH